MDHVAVAGSGSSATQDLHRIDEAFTKNDIGIHAFHLLDLWHGYRNAGDDRLKPVFEKAVRGKTDRFAHFYRKQ